MPSQTTERINNLIDMNDYFTSIANDVDLFNGIINGRILEIPSLILEKEDAIELTKIIYDEVDTGIFKAIINASSSKDGILVSIGITAVAEVITNSDGEGTKDLVKKGFGRLIAKFKRKGLEIMEKERKFTDSD
ncbi:MAG TPA: hypothetical protein VFP49_00850 [Nitrososphaeraceae archaeon]|nr:hypothetical protein [Nitrososphaeraceae archaeon]